MRIIKLAFISFLILFGIVTLISLVIPSQIRLSKIITIRAEKDSVFSIIKNRDQWFRWHPSYSIAGGDKQKLLKISTRVIVENDSILQIQWQQGTKKAILNEWRLFAGEEEYASLQWSLTLNTGWYPWEKLGVLMYEPTYGKMMEEGLANIKELLER